MFLLMVGPAFAESPQPGDVGIVAGPKTVHFTIITPKGYVGFDAGRDWPVMALQTRPPILVAAFQIADPADRGTSDSTNLAIRLIQPESAAGQAALVADQKNYGDRKPEAYHGWSVQAWSKTQGSTMYSIVDARADRADMTCTIRLAWPHLANHPAGYDADMQALLKRTLDSVQAGLGTYPPRPGELFRTPEK